MAQSELLVHLFGINAPVSLPLLRNSVAAAFLSQPQDAQLIDKRKLD
jgi:hypothetical protein